MSQLYINFFLAALAAVFVCCCSTYRDVPVHPVDVQQWDLIEHGNGRIVGGRNVTNGGAPYQVALYRSGLFYCGGSLVGARSVVTAAHCIYG